MAYESFALVYDRLMADMPYARWLAFIEQCLADGVGKGSGKGTEKSKSVSTGLTLVDLGCGTGNLALPLAAKGHRLIAVDNAADMLAVAAQKSMSGDIQFIETDMCELQLPDPVDAVYSFCDSINYVTDEAALQTLFHNVRHMLREGGLFVFDVHSEQTFLHYHETQPFVLDEPDLAYIWTCEYEAPLIHHQLSIFCERADSPETYNKIEEQHVQRAYSIEELRTFLSAAGFFDVNCYADFTFEPADEQTSRLFFVAR